MPCNAYLAFVLSLSLLFFNGEGHQNKQIKCLQETTKCLPNSGFDLKGIPLGAIAVRHLPPFVTIFLGGEAKRVRACPPSHKARTLARVLDPDPCCSVSGQATTLS